MFWLACCLSPCGGGGPGGPGGRGRGGGGGRGGGRGGRAFVRVVIQTSRRGYWVGAGGKHAHAARETLAITFGIAKHFWNSKALWNSKTNETKSRTEFTDTSCYCQSALLAVKQSF